MKDILERGLLAILKDLGDEVVIQVGTVLTARV
jgi:hypothetical protein